MSPNKYLPKYPLIWQKDDFFIEIFCSIPNVATGILLTTDKSYFIIDPGDGILRDLNKNLEKEEILKISDIFITHGHHDHIGGFWSFLTYLSVMKKKTPLHIYYPKGCLEIESMYKAFTEVYASELSFEITLHIIEDEKSFRRKSISVKPFWVDHREHVENNSKAVPIPSLGYKFTYNKKSICYGGDTAFCDNLLKQATGSDLAIIEAGADGELDSELHMTRAEAAQIGESAKEYFLVHVPE